MPAPGTPGPLDDPILREKAEAEAERLLEDLKEQVQAEIQDIGTLRKELRITVPEKVIADHLDHNYDELMHDVIVPGFRKGRAPRALVEKRFGAEVRQSLTTSIVGQSFLAVTEKHELEVLGDPLFRIESEAGVKLVDFDEAMQSLKLPASGDFTYVCEVEVKPTFELPPLEGIEIKLPEAELTDEMVEEEIDRQCKIRGRYEPRLEEPAERDDLLVADVKLVVEDQEVKHEENVQLGVRPAAVDGIPLPKLDEVLAGVRVGETREAECTLPDDYERADLRGKPGRFVFHVHEIKRLVPLSRAEFCERNGFENEAELREFVRSELEFSRDRLLGNLRREQIYKYLLENTKLDLPEKLSARHVERAVRRRMIELQQQGVPDGEIAANIDHLRATAREEVVRDLKLSFIMEKVADQLGVEVTDEEVNTEIAMMARRYNRRFDRVRDELFKAGLLDQLVDNIRFDKCIRRLLEDAKVTEIKGQAAESDDKKEQGSPGGGDEGEAGNPAPEST